jgi:hypothetical protein
MEKRFRISAIGCIRPGVLHDQVKAAVAAKLAEKGMAAEGLRWITIPSRRGKRLYAKFSTVVPAAELDDAWNIAASRAFADAGYGNVTWKITPIAADDPAGEDTTCSLPSEAMQHWLRSGGGGPAQRSPLPPEPFGSERFWAWFEDFDES